MYYLANNNCMEQKNKYAKPIFLYNQDKPFIQSTMIIRI